MKPYEKYKDSGVEWIGKVPEHWEVKRGDSIFVLSKNIAKQTGLNGQQVFHYSIPVIQETGTGTIEDGDTVDSDKFILEGNEILFSKLNPRKGTVVISQKHELLTIASTEFVILKPKKDDIKFLFYFLKSNGFQDSVCSVVQSATRSHQRANPVDIYKNKILVPPLPEQTAIARYLDQKTTDIDQLIAQKERLLALWEEEKTAVINQAVTRGLDAGAKMKDSGVAWLGEIPEHWVFSKIGFISKVVRGASPRPAGDPRYFNGNHTPWITVAELTKDSNKYLDSVSEYLTEEGATQSRFVEVGTLLMSNSGATLGVPKILNIGGCINDGSVAFLNLNPKISIDFLYHFLASLTSTFRDLMKGSGQPNLNTDIVKSTVFCYPEIPEQTAIVRHIETQTARIQTQMGQTRKLIELLKEYRATLISEVVTGKVKITA